MKFIDFFLLLIPIYSFNLHFPLNFLSSKLHKYNSKINQINGFYGLIGPNVNISKTNTLFQLFTGDGIIQGIFLENGSIKQVNHIIQTEKIIFEKNNGKFSNNMIFLPLYMFLNKIGFLPNVMGLANTAFIKIKNKIFVLFERDYPYQIHIDFIKKNIHTIKKFIIKDINHFSAHSTIDNNTVYSLEYNVLNNFVSLFHFNHDLQLLKKFNIKTNYIPIIHDSFVLPNSTIFTDSPLFFSFYNLFNNKIPVVFNTNKPTFIHQIFKNNTHKIYSSNHSFYIFHYANITEFKDFIEILAPVYDFLDFSKLNISGKYRRLLLNKKNYTIHIHKNPELEKYNLDFPIQWNNYFILRNIENNKINGFVICDGINIKKKIFLNDLSICGEPKIYQSPSFSRIMCLAYNNNNNYFLLINPENGKIFKFPLHHKLIIGFHSIFIKKN
jgi:hypothetical protein